MAATAEGLQAVVDLGMRLLRGPWAESMRASRLTGLYKSEARTAVRPVAAGEALRRVIGSAMIELRKDAIERVLLAAHQFAFT